MALPISNQWHECKICKHEYLLKAHSGHCPMCGCIAEKFMRQDLAFNASGVLLNVVRAKGCR